MLVWQFKPPIKDVPLWVARNFHTLDFRSGKLEAIDVDGNIITLEVTNWLIYDKLGEMICVFDEKGFAETFELLT